MSKFKDFFLDEASSTGKPKQRYHFFHVANEDGKPMNFGKLDKIGRKKVMGFENGHVGLYGTNPDELESVLKSHLDKQFKNYTVTRKDFPA